jgi:hypothetical protein
MGYFKNRLSRERAVHMKNLERFAELVSRRNWFLAIYSLIAVIVGLVNLWAIVALGFSAQQLLVLSVPGILVDGAFFSTARPLVTTGIHLCGLAPFILILLAIIRGRRIGNRVLVIFPVLGLVVDLLGAFPFVLANVKGEVVVLAPTILTWILDVACLRRGAHVSKVTRPMNHPKA